MSKLAKSTRESGDKSEKRTKTGVETVLISKANGQEGGKTIERSGNSLGWRIMLTSPGKRKETVKKK